jgi:Bacterial SH3 domain
MDSIRGVLLWSRRSNFRLSASLGVLNRIGFIQVIAQTCLRWPRARFVALFLAGCFAIPPAAAQIYHDPRRKTTVGFQVELKAPAATIAEIVRRVSNDGYIRGSKIFARKQDIEDAESATSSNAFTDTVANAQVFYKIRKNALSPANFPGSNDMGTITVRYIVEPVNPNLTRLRIDAIFISDSVRVRYPSDGSVETAEYGEIFSQLRELTQPASASERASRVTTADTTGLQQTLADEQDRFDSVRESVAHLEQQVKQLQFNTMGRVKSPGVPLKASPYNRASTLGVLNKAEILTVLATTQYWYRVRRKEGDEGWIYYVFLEPLQ